ncbi:HIT family protein [Streptomyces sp. NPDC050844]|uniref:HIT family protein n=1 Tax=Streptomyces sp. NPDC050844 TaxID=3155790 RepID=UPI0033EB4608
MTTDDLSECPFCLIVQEHSMAEVVFESPDNIAFFPLNPATLGHTLVVPKKHVRDLWDLESEAAKSLMDSTLRVAQGLRVALRPQGINLINSSGSAASQTIFHLHMHLVPRWDDDRVGNIWPPKRPMEAAVRERLADEVREGMETARRLHLPS